MKSQMLAPLLPFLLLLLTGCLADQRATTARCTLEAHRAHPNAAVNGGNPDDQVLGDVVLCMTTAGYSFDLSSQECQPGSRPMQESPWCYKPMGYVAEIGWWLEMKITAMRRAG